MITGSLAMAQIVEDGPFILVATKICQVQKNLGHMESKTAVSWTMLMSVYPG